MPENEEVDLDKASIIQAMINHDVDDSEDAPTGLTYADLQAKVMQCTECKSQIPDDIAERNVFYQSGQAMPCPFCGGVCAVVPEALASTQYFQNRLDQIRGIGMTGYIPGVTAE